MIPQALSNCLFAAMRLADAVPEVLEALPALVKEVPGKVEVMDSQDMANSLEALVVLEERLPIVELPGIAAAVAVQLKRLLPEVRGMEFALDVPMVVWACTKTGTCDALLLRAVAARLKPKTLESLGPWGLCSLAWAYRTLDEEGAFTDLLERLESEIARRGLREEEVLAERRSLNTRAVQYDSRP